MRTPTLINLILLVLLVSIMSVSPATGQDYIVGEGDVLEIKVYDNLDLNTTVRVSGDGVIGMPLLGQINVGGKSVSTIVEEIETLLADGYLVNPQVNVFIKEHRSKKVTILGEVDKPGLYELQGHTTLLELISKAGGLGENAGGQAIIKRKRNGGEGPEDTTAIDMKRLVEQGDTSLNVHILDGDSIYIAKAGVFFVTGEVKKASSYKLEDNPTVIKAITLAGGFTDKAAPDKVRIIRKIDGREMVLEKVKLDESVLKDDVIVVPESFF